MQCYVDPNCVSFNFKTTSDTGTRNCEINNSTRYEDEEDFENDSRYVYRGVKVKNNLVIHIFFSIRNGRVTSDVMKGNNRRILRRLTFVL